MKMIEPMTVTAANLLDSNVPINEIPWTAGTYSSGTQRSVGIELYEVVVPSTTDEPIAGSKKTPKTWFKIGNINRFNAFDGFLFKGSEVASGTMFWRVQTEAIANSVALFNVDADSATIRFRRQSDDTILQEQTIELIGRDDPETFWEWAFDPFESIDRLLILDGPSGANQIVEIEIDGGLTASSVGEIFIGNLQEIGETLYGTDEEINDFSLITRDDFGNLNFLPRPASDRISYIIRLKRKKDAARVKKLLLSRLAVASVYIGSEDYPNSVTAGIPRNIRMRRVGPEDTEILFEVEGFI